MSIELLQTLSLVSYIIAGVLFLLAVVLFFVLRVPSLYGDVSGRTARKAIEAIRQQNESSGNKAYKPSAVNAQRGKLTDKISHSGRVQAGNTHSPVSVGTEKLHTDRLREEAEGAAAPPAPETTMLPANETTLLEQPANETTLLEQPANETTLLEQEGGQPAAPVGITIEVEMGFHESMEIIE